MTTAPTAAALVTQATRLFAAQGYASTSVADIQVACGLTAGSGALYKHFASKRALLDAVVDVHLESMRQGARLLDDVPDEPSEALAFIAEAVHAAMDRDRAVLRIILRDLDSAPDLLDRVWSELDAQVYGEFASWLSTRDDIAIDDVQTTATVLLAGLTAPLLLKALVGRVPGGIDEAEFRRVWVSSALAVLTAGPLTPGGPRVAPADGQR